jgi:hypothetical protein
MTEPAISIKEYVDALFKASETRTEQARLTMEKRLDGMNEFRDALRDQAANSPSRIEMETKFEAIEKELKTLNTFMDTVGGKANQSDVTAARLVGYIGLGVALVSLGIRLFAP